MSSRLRRPVRLLGTLLLTAGVLVLVWVIVVWRWQDPFTAIQAHFSQEHLRSAYVVRSKTFQRRLPTKPAKDPAVAWKEATAAARAYRQDFDTHAHHQHPGRSASSVDAGSRRLRRRQPGEG